MMKKLTVGVLAHVDAGKTTLSEAMLYTAGAIRTLGRVDHGSTSLDTHGIERKRGITIFSKQARLSYADTELCLLDTPGHVDFSAETERTVSVLDAALLVISGTDGVQAHTETLWRLLRRRRVPTFIFVTKTDLAGFDRERVLRELREQLSEGCLELTDAEELAMCDEAVLEHYMESGGVSDDDIRLLISSCAVFPVLFGSGLRLEGIDELLSTLCRYAEPPHYPDAFGARVFKILRDSKGQRLTVMKITGGSLKTKDTVSVSGESAKINELRLYSGAKFESVSECCAGEICAAAGLDGSYIGQGLGYEEQSPEPELYPVLSYRVRLPEGSDPREALKKLRQLEEEDPLLRIVWEESLREIHIELMGEVQTEVIRDIISERFDMEVSIDNGGIMYRETIAGAVEGVGHFEPLRHYAEVHLLLEPLKRGSGIEIGSVCPTDELDRSWQNLILTNIAEKQHLGVLTGSPITDIRISLLAGRAHPKHTEGGDFREAVYRAVRQGLMQAKSVLLEPWYAFRIEVPHESLGRVISDVRMMSGEFSAEDGSADTAVIRGRAPVSEMNGYASELAGFTRGRGRIYLSRDGWHECHNSERVIEEKGYEPESDVLNTADSVFCSHGSGTLVKWSEVRSYMHLDTGFGREAAPSVPSVHRTWSIDDKELERIMEREFGPVKRRLYTRPARCAESEYSVPPSKRDYVIIDGYNLIFGSEKLKKLAEDSLSLARERLIDELKSYQGMKDNEVVLVFDGYRVQGNIGEKGDDGRLHLVYTKENETGDMYIEKLANDIGKSFGVRVVTNDSLIRLSALRSGVLRMSVAEFLNELEEVRAGIREFTDGK